MKKYIIVILILLFGFRCFSQSAATRLRYQISVQEYNPFTRSCVSVDNIGEVLTPNKEMIKKNAAFIANYYSLLEIFTYTPIDDFTDFFSFNPRFELMDESFCPPTDTSSTSKTFVVWNKGKVQNIFYREILSQTQAALISLKQRIDYRLEKDEYSLNDFEKNDMREMSRLLSAMKLAVHKDETASVSDESNIQLIAEIISKNPQLKIIFELTVVDSGSEEDDRAFALKITNEVRDIFIRNGVPSNQIETASYTIDDPQRSQLSKSKVRDVVFRIVKR